MCSAGNTNIAILYFVVVVVVPSKNVSAKTHRK